MTKINSLSLVAIAVLCAMPTGYRRAGFSLVKGENSLDVNKEQYEALDADKNLTVSVVSDDLKFIADAPLNNGDLEDQITCLKKKMTELTTVVANQQADIKELEEQLKTALAANHVDTFTDLRVVIEADELDLSSAPQELHHWIEAIDDLNEETPLTKKPNCDLLTITVDDNSVTPTAAERDAAWAWYQANIVTATDPTHEGKA